MMISRCDCFGLVWLHVNAAGTWFGRTPYETFIRGKWITDDFGDLWLLWDTVEHLR